MNLLLVFLLPSSSSSPFALPVCNLAKLRNSLSRPTLSSPTLSLYLNSLSIPSVASSTLLSFPLSSLSLLSVTLTHCFSPLLSLSTSLPLSLVRYKNYGCEIQLKELAISLSVCLSFSFSLFLSLPLPFARALSVSVSLSISTSLLPFTARSIALNKQQPARSRAFLWEEEVPSLVADSAFH